MCNFFLLCSFFPINRIKCTRLKLMSSFKTYFNIASNIFLCLLFFPYFLTVTGYNVSGKKNYKTVNRSHFCKMCLLNLDVN